MTGYVYVIQSLKNGAYYVGSSKNPTKRLVEHNNGKVRATKNKGPWSSKLVQKYPTVRVARQIEYKIKKLKRRDYISQIIKDGFIKIRQTGCGAVS